MTADDLATSGSQVINSHGIDPVLPKHSGFSVTGVNLIIPKIILAPEAGTSDMGI